MNMDESLNWMKATFELVGSEEKEEDEPLGKHQYLDYLKEMEEYL